ncbi:hypothetical protein ACJ41O_008755 [Fusarium nematophilum]
MSERDSQPSKIDLLLMKADNIEARLSEIEKLFEATISQVAPHTRSTRPRKEQGQDLNEQPTWVKDLRGLLDGLKVEIQAIRSDAKASKADDPSSDKAPELADASANGQDGSPAMDSPVQIGLGNRDGNASVPGDREHGSQLRDPERDARISPQTRVGYHPPSQDTAKTGGEEPIVSDDVDMVDCSEEVATSQLRSHPGNAGVIAANSPPAPSSTAADIPLADGQRQERDLEGEDISDSEAILVQLQTESQSGQLMATPDPGRQESEQPVSALVSNTTTVEPVTQVQVHSSDASLAVGNQPAQSPPNLVLDRPEDRPEDIPMTDGEPAVEGPAETPKANFDSTTDQSPQIHSSNDECGPLVAATHGKSAQPATGPDPNTQDDPTGGTQVTMEARPDDSTSRDSDAAEGSTNNQSSQLSATRDPERRGHMVQGAPSTVPSHGSDTADGASTASTTDTHLTSPDASQASGPPSEFTLSEADMGEGFTEALEKIITRPDFDNEISVPTFSTTIDLDLIKAELSSKNNDWQYAANTFKPGPGYTHVYVSKKKSLFKWPDFSKAAKVPTHEEARKWLDNFFDSPPEDPVPYFCGHLDIPYNNLLNPGPGILNEPELADLHQPYWHIGADKSANRLHWEDLSHFHGEIVCGLRAANLVLVGVKLWILIATHHTKKFETLIRKRWKCGECSQGPGHISVLLSPSKLEQEGIDFVIKICPPGKMIDTRLCQYHGIVNMGPCIAMSINHTRPGDRLISESLRRCGLDGVSPFAIRHGVPLVPSPASSDSPEPASSNDPERRKLPSSGPAKRKAQEELANTTPKTRASTEAKRKLRKVKEDISTIYRAPKIDHSNPSLLEVAAFKRAAAVRSSLMIRQFMDLVREWREQQSNFVGNPDQDLLDQAVEFLKFNMGKSKLSKFRLRLAQMRLAQTAEKAKGPIQIHHEPGYLDDLASKHDMDKNTLKRHISNGKMWSSICGPYDGLLAFIPLDSCNDLRITKAEWMDLVRNNLATFHHLLDDSYTHNICSAGKTFEDMVISGSQVVFGWEGNEPDPDAKDVDSVLGECHMAESEDS